MADQYEIQYMNTERNASAIAAAASKMYADNAGDKQANSKYGSFNFFTITNQSGSAIQIDLDGQTNFSWTVQGNVIFGIDATEGYFFNTIKVTELDSAEIAANKVTINYGRAVLKQLKNA